MTIVARVAFLVLVGASFSAFFVAQRLKSTPPVIEVRAITLYFSPNGDGKKDVNRISLRLRVSDDATIDVVNLDGDRVKRLADSTPMVAHRPLRLVWDGTGDDGRVVPDGQYRLRVALRKENRSATVQKTTTVDTRAPTSQVCVGTPCSDTKNVGNIVSQGDRAIKIYIKGVSPTLATRFKLFRTDEGKPRQVATLPNLAAGLHRLTWEGLVEGKPLPPGTYLVQSEVRDKAGNRGITPAEFEVGAIPGRPGLTVRGLAAQPPLRPVTAGQRVEFHVDARGAQYRWRVRRVGDSAVRKRGTETAAVLAFRAPQGPSGVYLLELRSGRWHTAVPFLVQAEKRSSILLVVPTISWLGTDKVDDRPFDGLPNTLTDGGTVRWPRAFAGTDGLPAGWSELAPLLVWLDRQKIRYDLTSDLDLDLTRNPRASDRTGVLFAGSEHWITRPLAKRLRSYVNSGGRVAMFGADSMRRGVRLRVYTDGEAGTLSRATQPTATDPFGARFGKPRTLLAPVTLSQFEGDEQYGLMEGATDLAGFKELEESNLVEGKANLASVGQPLTPEEESAAVASGKDPREIRPALSATQLGKGVVIRVGLPEWTGKLADGNVAQVTHNIIDILRKVEPTIRSAR
ncbi:N,N-dimethylformamidase beta subunit family domain-containing protein [Solirubrobacter soli]|uniref:N,N-dimethylformamidase beta subunit family domain-containing protein n=1 Tax=Solirubrobacter soli TaxID=363832 RepID=UPI0004835B17|nr:N,N-dimethylformamidase beta subunit family domain-containing protein [Solirubrobacter soli]